MTEAKVYRKYSLDKLSKLEQKDVRTINNS